MNTLVDVEYQVPARESPRWDAIYPQRSGPWPAVLSRGDVRLYGLYDPATGHSRPAWPEDDAALPGLAPWLQRGTLVSYRVGHRAVVRFEQDGPVGYATILRPSRTEALVRRTRAVKQAQRLADSAFPDLARLVAWDLDGMIVFGELPGRPLHELLLAPSSEPVLTTVARSLAALHQAPTEGLGLPPPDPGMPLSEWAALAGRHEPGLAPRYRRALAALGGLPAAPSQGNALVHGDLHDRNIFVDHDRVGLLDLDSLHLGHPVEDVGNLVAHLVVAALQRGASVTAGRRGAEALIAAYREAGGDIEPAAVAASGARSLFRLACLYQFRRRWVRIVPALLGESARWAGLRPGG